MNDNNFVKEIEDHDRLDNKSLLVNIDKTRKIKLNEDLWIAFPPKMDKLVIGGSFLPKEIHLTMSYGVHSGFLDFHLTNNKNRRHALIFKIKHKNIEKLFYSFINRLFKEKILKKVDPNVLSEEGYLFIPFPVQNNDKYLCLADMIPEFENLVKRKGEISYKYNITLEDQEVTELISKIFNNDSDYFLIKWVKENIYNPTILSELNDFKGIVFKDDNVYIVGTNLNVSFIFESEKILENNGLKLILGDTLWELFLKRWKIALENVQNPMNKIIED